MVGYGESEQINMMTAEDEDISRTQPAQISDQQDTAARDDDTDNEDLPEGTSLFSSAMRIISTPFSGSISPIPMMD